MTKPVAFVVRDVESRMRFIDKLMRAPFTRADGRRWPLVVTVERLESKRSLAQNRLYWMWLGLLCDHILASTGERFSDDELHEWFKAKFLPTRLVEINGEAVKAHKSTAKLKTMEFSQYLNDIDQYSSGELDFILPHPEELYAVAMAVSP